VQSHTMLYGCRETTNYSKNDVRDNMNKVLDSVLVVHTELRTNKN
jgi:hypothetical protein